MGRSIVNHAVITVMTANLLLFLSGLSMSWPSSQLMRLLSPDNDVTLTMAEATWLVSLLPAGAILGPFFFGILASIIGRKKTLLLLSLPFLFAYLALAFAPNKWMYFTARFACGLSVGGTYTVTPLYIGEIADKSNRGILSSFMNISTCLGILLTYLVGPYVSFYLFNVMISIIPAAFLVLFTIVGIETPYFYVSKHKDNLAKATLEKLRNCSGRDIDAEMEEIQGRIVATSGGKFRQISQSMVLLKAMFMATGLLFFQQFTGVNVVMFYSEYILQQVGRQGMGPEHGMIIGGVFFLSSLTCPLLIEKIGRKSCMTTSCIGVSISLAILAGTSILKDYDILVNHEIIVYLPITALVTFMIFFNIGLGPIPNIVLGEIFPPKIKSIASSALIMLSWVASFIVSMSIGYVIIYVGTGIMFAVFAVLAVVGFVFNHFFVIETKGKSLQEIQDLLRN